MRNEKGQFIKGEYWGSGFKVGHIPWNKNKKGIHLSKNSEFKKGMTPWNKGTGKGWSKDKSVKNYIYLRGTTIKNRGVRKHRMIMEEYLGKKLTRKEVVHHIDGNTLNNKIENLQVMSISEHASLHLHHKNEN